MISVPGASTESFKFDDAGQVVDAFGEDVSAIVDRTGGSELAWSSDFRRFG